MLFDEPGMIVLAPVDTHRIIAKVDELLALCDRLEAHLRGAKETAGDFATAAVHHLDVA